MPDNQLTHYGVPGMKWGQRRAEGSVSGGVGQFRAGNSGGLKRSPNRTVAQKLTPKSRQDKYAPAKVKKQLTQDQKEMRTALILAGASVAARLAIPLAVTAIGAAQDRKNKALVDELFKSSSNAFSDSKGIGAQPVISLLKDADGVFRR